MTTTSLLPDVGIELREGNAEVAAASPERYTHESPERSTVVWKAQLLASRKENRHG